MGKFMISDFLSGLKNYKKQWEEVNSRKFKQEELNVLGDTVEVVASTYGRSFCLTMIATGDKKYVPVDKNDLCDVGEVFDTSNLELVKLHYCGENPEIIKNLKPDRCITRGRIVENSGSSDITDFDNPLGI